jgi:hypothetical protein
MNRVYAPNPSDVSAACAQRPLGRPEGLSEQRQV